MAFIAERWILSTHFFDFLSTQDIEFNSYYRGFDAGNADEVEQVIQQGFYSHSRNDIDDISNYLFEKFSLPKVRGYQFIDDGISRFKFEKRRIEFIDVLKNNVAS